MSAEYSDLRDVLAEVSRNVADSRLIWCTTADGFETTVSSRRGLILGGAWSPHFLRDREAAWWDVPWTMKLQAPTIVTIEKAVMPLSEWMPSQDITIISVGGKNHDNQHDRLRFLVEAIQNRRDPRPA